jgi:hypothetical protein
MSEHDLREFLAAIKRIRAENASSPEKARQFLKEEGYLTDDGLVAEPYSSSPRR